MSDRPRPATRLGILAGKIVEGADGTYLRVERSPIGYAGPEYLPVPFACTTGDRVCISYAITPPDPEHSLRRRVIDLRGAPSRPGPA